MSSRNNKNRKFMDTKKKTYQYDMEEIERINALSNNEEYINTLRDTEDFEEFDDMEFISEQLMENISDYGFKAPSFVQSKIIHRIFARQDMIIESDSGTGKTGAFVIGSVALIEPNKVHPQIIIIANTKQLSKQIKAVVDNFTERMGIRTCLCIGNNNTDNSNGNGRPQRRNTSNNNAKQARKSHILIGTPGRLMDISNKNVYKAEDIKVVIMDEADDLLKTSTREDGGFIQQIRSIVMSCHSSTNFCLFSATYTTESYECSKNFLTDPERIVIKQEKSTDRIYQYCIDLTLPPEDKYTKSGIPIKRNRINDYILQDKIDNLISIFEGLDVNQAIIFTNNTKHADSLRYELGNSGFKSVEIINGKIDAARRDLILKNFRLAKIKFLISTDFISRGFDVDDLRCVVNFDFPDDPQTYIHRIGRSGRFGGEGIAINMITEDDFMYINNIKENYPEITIYDQLPTVDRINEILNGMTKPINKASAAQLAL